MGSGCISQGSVKIILLQPACTGNMFELNKTLAMLLSKCNDDEEDSFDDLDSCLYKSIKAKAAFSRWINEAEAIALLMQSY